MVGYVQLRLGLKPSERAAALMETLGVEADGTLEGANGGNAFPPVRAALLASEVLQDCCAGARASDRVHGEPFLLYWRGVLARCLSQDGCVEQ
jgi:hypothetical protein